MHFCGDFSQHFLAPCVISLRQIAEAKPVPAGFDLFLRQREIERVLNPASGVLRIPPDADRFASIALSRRRKKSPAGGGRGQRAG